jgi:hypothetical protein
MAIAEHRDLHLDRADRRLVNLLTSVLVDPNLHTDARMRLYERMSEILHAPDQGAPRARESEGARTQAVPPPAQPLPDLLARVLVDPNLHTDTRMRLHQEITEMLDLVQAGEKPGGK